MSIDLGSAFGKILIDAQDALDQTGRLGGALSGLGGPAAAMGTAVAVGAAAAGTALVALGVSSVGVARDFESSMAVMSTAVDPESLGVSSTAEAMGILSEASLQVGSDTSLVGVSASSAAEAITGLYKAGLSTGEIFGDLQGYMAGTSDLSGALRASVDLAAASELDMVQASELAAVTLATFGGGLETTEERAAFVESAMNNFVQTADGSVASVADLADAFTNIGSTAAGMGIPLEDVNTMLGVLSTRGIAGAEAGTAVKSMLTNMMTAPKAAEALDDLGVSLYDVNGQMRPMEAIIGDLESAMAGMTDEQRTQTVVALASSYGQKALNALLAEGSGGWADMEDAIAGAATMQETAAARTNTLAGAQEALSGVWEAFQIKVGTALIPALTALSDIGAALLEKYGPTLQAAFETIGAVLSSFFANLQGGMSPLNAFIEAIWDIAPPEVLAALVNFRDNILPGLLTAFHNIVDPIVAAVTNFVSFKDVLVGLGLVIAAAVIPAIVGILTAVAPIALAFAGIIAVVALLRNAWENDWGGIQEKTQAVVDFVRGIVETGLAAIRTFWDEHGAAIQAAAEAAWGAIQAAIELVVGVVTKLVEGALADIREFWDEHGEAITKIAKDAWEIISTAIDDALEIVKDVFDAFRKLFEGDWEGFTDGIQEVWEDIWQAIADFLGGLWDMVSPWLEQFWESIKEWFKPEKWLDLGKNIIQGIVDGINAVGMDILNVLGDWVQAAIDWAKSLLGISSPSQVFFDIGENIGQGLINGIRATAADAAAALEALFEAMGNVSGLAGGFGNQFQRRVLDPLRRGVEASQGSIDEMTAALERMATQLGYEEGFLNRPDAILELMRRVNYQYATPAEKATAQTMLAFLRERNRLQVQHVQLQRDLAEQEERLALLQEKQAQNDFLQQQLELIKFVKDNNLSADILNGITWGIGADAGALMDAMRRALTQMIAEAQKTLGISSPSRVFREMGMQVNRGLLVGLADNRPVLAAARGMMDEIAAQAAAASFPALAAGGRTAHLYGGQHFYFQQPGGSILDDVQRLLAP